jgi:hypothetical protein
MSVPRTQLSHREAISRNNITIEALPLSWAHRLPEWLGHCRIDSGDLSCFERPTIGLVSSHSEQNAFTSARWQSRLNAALNLARQQRYDVLFSAETPYAAAIEQSCRRLNVPYVSLFRSATNQEHALTLNVEQDTTDSTLSSLPFLDRAVIALSQHLFVLELRNEGKISRLIQRRLQMAPTEQGTVFLGWGGMAKDARYTHWLREWLDRGVVGWFVPSDEFEVSRCESHWSCGNRPPPPFTLVPRFSLDHCSQRLGKFLVHCTRARQGPWPDQTWDQFYDEVMLHPWQASPTPLQTMERILRTQRLIATSHLKSSSTPTISFSACPIADLLSRRRFQPHLGRWDWEPYGLMISNSWLQDRGCTPVTYVERSAFKRLSKDQTTFLQPFEETGKGRDWREEQEWRLAKDLRLQDLPFSAGIVFVRTSEEAKQLESLSRWPICSVEPH